LSREEVKEEKDVTSLKSILSDSNYEAVNALWTQLTCDEKELKEVRSLHPASLVPVWPLDWVPAVCMQMKELDLGGINQHFKEDVTMRLLKCLDKCQCQSSRLSCRRVGPTYSPLCVFSRRVGL
jgi:hypothetical protein